MSKVFEALAALAAVGTFIVTFLDSYEIKFRIRRRARTVRDEGRRGRRSKRRYEKAIGAASPAAQLLSAGSGCHNGL